MGEGVKKKIEGLSFPLEKPWGVKRKKKKEDIQGGARREKGGGGHKKGPG